MTMGIDSAQWLLTLGGGTLPDRNLIGGKAWSIARMSGLGLHVPPAFVITTRACAHYLAEGSEPESLAAEIDAGVAWLEQQTGRLFGAGPSPLLVSVRSGAPVSMPGMMDTVLNLGINEETEAALGTECGDAAFARDTHRRFLDLYAQIVLKTEIDLARDETPATWRDAIASQGSAVPVGAREQLAGAVRAVFESWNSRRARRYREHNNIAHDIGTAVTVQAMVFGNMDERSGTGVLFSRNPLTGDPAPYGEYLSRAQGEDIVSGKHTPMPLDTLRETLPDVHDALLAAASLLEKEDGDVQDIEFTVERGKLYLLQARAAKRAPLAAVRIAVDMVREGIISQAEAIGRVSPEQIRILLSPQLADGAAVGARVLAQGEAASPGVGVGLIVMDSDHAEAAAREGTSVILARETTSPNDLHGMIAARAILTEQGGSTSHAAVVGRALGRPCVVGCGVGSLHGLEGQIVTVVGQTGTVYAGELPVVLPREEENETLRLLSDWSRQLARIAVVAEARADAHIVDFDDVVGEEQGAFAVLPHGATVKGALFANDETAVREAIAAGAAEIVTSPLLPALLAAAQASTPDQKE